MKWLLVQQQVEAGRSPWRIVDQAGQAVEWLNDFLDAQCLRGLAPLTVQMYAQQLLHFGRWWAGLERPWEAPDSKLIAAYLQAQSEATASSLRRDRELASVAGF